MNTQVQQSMPATTEQIAAALQILFNSMPFPKGTDPEKAVLGYITALQGLPIQAIASGIRKFLRGECKDVSMKFCPHPPELAAIIRETGYVPSASKGPSGALYRYTTPKSKVLERNVTKEYAWRLIDNKVHPRGCIWLPGDLYDHPEIGDLFAPDENWQRPVKVEQAS